ncbi:Lar family restriction alleviation protein [Faecalispora jeddahensis]|uniref:Lar family restriction alleviation protein n=1 Tax=Faecalispora jeddahensis TaxID=1414721 RepID=UPI00189B1A3F|nr:Lar family restriction alleviation protein [Faecalispora jeddahensis]
MDELKPCPFCGGGADFYIGGSGYIQCTHCLAMIPYRYGLPYADGKQQAIAAWNRRPAPGNKPLTLEQLRQMDGEPIWFDWNDIGWAKVVMIDGHPRIAAVVNHGAFGYQCHLYTPTDIDGNSHAYARKPEREEK